MASELINLEEQSVEIETQSKESVTLYDRAKQVIVIDQHSHDLAVEIYKAALALEKAVHAAHDPVCSHWSKLHDQACANRKADLDKVLDAKKLAKSKYDEWELAEEQKRIAEERRLHEEARKNAEEEARLANEAAERSRKDQLLAYACDLNLTMKRLAELAGMTNEQIMAALQEEERLRLAQEAAATGATEEQVIAILETPVRIDMPDPEPIPEWAAAPVMPTVEQSFQKASGVSARWKYCGVVVNLHELIQAAAENQFFSQYLQPNKPSIDALARGSKDKFALPGCKLDKKRV
jgi:hypothetical protein